MGDGGVVGVEGDHALGRQRRERSLPRLRDGVDFAVAVELVAKQVREDDSARRELADDLRQRRLVDAVLILAAIALAFIVISDLASVFYAFGDVVLLFFLAWLVSFALLLIAFRIFGKLEDNFAENI